MTDNYLYAHPTLAGVYDVICGWSEDRDFYLNLAAGGKQSILDVGCGTGLLCRAYATQGNHVVGLDPSASMLAVATEKSPDDSIRYIHGTLNEASKTLPELEKSFDLIVMTGHAFQCITTELAVIELFKHAKRLLKPNGRFVFESRNPDIDWVSRWHGSTSSWDSAFGPFRWSTQIVEHSMAGTSIDTISYKHLYEFEHETIVGADTLRFMPLSSIASLLNRAGFTSITVYGDWNGVSYAASQSDEMIFDIRH